MKFEWTQRKQQTFQRKIRKKQFDFTKFPKGAYCCAFIPVTKHVAVKLYRSCHDRDECHRYQLLAERHGMAPKTGAKFRVRLQESYYGTTEKPSYYYGFLTEIAQTKGKKFKRMKKDYDSLFSIYGKIGLVANDMYENNVGLLKGKLVSIDFSCFDKTKEVRRKVLEAA